MISFNNIFFHFILINIIIIVVLVPFILLSCYYCSHGDFSYAHVNENPKYDIEFLVFF